MEITSGGSTDPAARSLAPVEGIAAFSTREGAFVMGTFIDASSQDKVTARIGEWALAREARTVYFCNAHSLVTAQQDPGFASVIANADLALPDGAPVAWMLRRLGFRQQQRVSGPDMMVRVCEFLAERRAGVFFYGSTPETLNGLKSWAALRFPGLRVAGAISPPFGYVDISTDEMHLAEIARSGASVVFVALGCPKQEIWCERHRDRLPGVVLAVGAAFDFHAGSIRRAPPWMRRYGLEWFHRLLSEPRRLWRRYLVTNTAFVLGAVRQLLRR